MPFLQCRWHYCSLGFDERAIDNWIDVSEAEKNRARLKYSENVREGPGVLGATEMRPNTSNCMGYVKIHFFRKKREFFSQKTPKISRFFAPFFSTQNNEDCSF